MYVFVLTVHIILSTLLVLVILMQPGKGGDVSSAFGGGASSQLFGASGPGNFLTRGTGAIATLFMITSITLAYYSTESAQNTGDVREELKTGDEGQEGGGFGVAPTTAPTDAPAVAPDAPAITPAPPALEPAPVPPSNP